MKRLIALAAVSAFGLAVPAVGLAGNGSVHNAAKQAAHEQCKTEKKADRAAFRANYGKHPMKTCVQQALGEVQQEFKNAAEECRTELDADPATFYETYGSNRVENPESRGYKRNAFGKCVSQKVHEDEAGVEDEVVDEVGDEELTEPEPAEGDPV
jgi:hypothetical protein